MTDISKSLEKKYRMQGPLRDFNREIINKNNGNRDEEFFEQMYQLTQNISVWGSQYI